MSSVTTPDPRRAMRQGLITTVLLLLGVWAFSPSARAQGDVQPSRGAAAGPLFHAALSGAHEDPAVISPASGYAVLALSADGSELSYRVLLDDISNVTAAHIHRVADGGVEWPLTVVSDGLIEGVITGITVEQATKLQQGDYYINVHTQAHGGGEIAGVIGAFTPPTGYSALLNGANERPDPVETEAIGVASFTQVSTDTLAYQIAVSNVVSITLAHIHVGPIEDSGPPVHTLYSGSGLFDVDHPLTGTVELDHVGWVDLLTGNYYVNVHTTSHGGGEMRGQLGGAHLFKAELDGNQETPPVATLAYGQAVLALSDDASTLVYRVTAQNLDEDIIAAHLHRGARGQMGPPDITLAPFGNGRVITGTESVTAAQIFRLISGNYYVNLHTPTHGGGEIRGQVEPYAPQPNFSALLTGGEQAPPVATAGAGLARFELRPVINVVDYYLAVTEIDNLTAAHIHKARSGESNPAPAHGLYASADGAFDPDHPVAGALLFDALDLIDLLTGYFYVNVHSTDFPAGEIRGQIGRSHLFVADLTAANEVPPQMSDAFGVGVFALNASTTQLVYRVFADGLDGDISLSHIHTGKPGVNGAPDFTLFNGAGQFDSANPISGTLTLTDAHVLKLVGGSYYINIHTASRNNAGVLRGQLAPLAVPQHFNALLTGDQETPPVVTEGIGVARLELEPLSGSLHYHVAVTNTTGITMAHIHRAPAGVSGGVVHGLYRSEDGPFDNEHPLIGNVVLNHNDLVNLLTGWFYINVHTTANLSGEIRGQIGGIRAYQALLNGANERPAPVVTDAKGVGTVVLTANLQTLYYRVVVTDIVDITRSHIHIGGPEAAGGVRFTLWDNGPGLFDPSNPISGVISLNTSDLQNLAAGKFYINVHTQENGGGEIRGQLEPYDPYGRFQTLLTTAATTAAAQAASAARGVAAFQLTPYPQTALQFEVSVAEIPTVTLAHIHKGLPGESGPPVFTLTATTGELSPATPLSGMVFLSAANLLNLLTDFYYVNVHTVEQPGGHIRGQLDVNGAVSTRWAPLIAAEQPE